DADVEALRQGGHPARARLVLEELYLLEVGLALRREERGREPGVPIAADGPRARAALRRLPFRLTRAQERAWAEIRADLARPHPMQRLLEGDGGGGRTVVAFLAAVAAAEGGRQTALMAPTELLAEQHARTLGRLVEATGGEAGLRVRLLTSSLARGDADRVRSELATRLADLAAGTPAQIQACAAFR